MRRIHRLQDEAAEFHFAGSAFWVSRDGPEDIKGQYRPAYLVTAAHVIDKAQKSGTSNLVWVRTNTKDGNQETFEIPVSFWRKHPDINVDVAVLKIGVGENHDNATVRRVRTLFRPSATVDSSSADISRTVEQEYARLSSFFRFKRRMDWIGVPVSCAIIAFVTLTLFGSGMSGNVLGGLILFAIWVGVSIAAVRAENKKRFIAPLHHLELLLEDLKHL